MSRLTNSSASNTRRMRSASLTPGKKIVAGRFVADRIVRICEVKLAAFPDDECFRCGNVDDPRIGQRLGEREGALGMNAAAGGPVKLWQVVRGQSGNSLFQRPIVFSTSLCMRVIESMQFFGQTQCPCPAVHTLE